MKNILNAILSSIITVARYHKLKVGFFLLWVVLFILFLFPKGDLADKASIMISQISQGRANIAFEDIGFTLMPQPGIKVSDVSIESVMFPDIKADSIAFAPKIFSMLFTKQPYGKLKAKGIFGGDGVVYISSSKVLDIKGPQQNIEVDLEDVELKELTSNLRGPMGLLAGTKGRTNLYSDIHVDPTMKAQPEGTYEVVINKLALPSISVPFGQTLEITFPALDLNQVKLKGTIKNGALKINEGKLGSSKNNMFGDITGEVKLKILKGGRTVPGSYNLKIDLSFKEELHNELAAMLGIIIPEQYKSQTMSGFRYAFRISGAQLGGNNMPSFSEPN